MEYENWTVKNLKDKLRELGLKITGSKSVLINRLKYHYESDINRYAGLKLADLKNLLSERNLSIKGNKNILIERLRASDPSLEIIESAKHILTGVKEVDVQILLRLDDRDLISSCHTDRYTASICDESFWNEKIQYNYGGANLRNYRGDNSYKEIYRELRYAEVAHPSIQKFFNYITKTRYVPIAKYLVNSGANVTIDNIINAASEIEMLSFLANNILTISQDDIIRLNGHVDYTLDKPLETLIIFKKLGADIRSEKLLKWAMQLGYFDKVKYLVENGTNIDNIDEYIWFNTITPKRSGSNSSIVYLIEKGAVFNANALLEHSIWIDNYEIAKYLLEEGYVNIRGNKGRLLDKARHSDKSMIQLLREHGAKYYYEDEY